MLIKNYFLKNKKKKLFDKIFSKYKNIEYDIDLQDKIDCRMSKFMKKQLCFDNPLIHSDYEAITSPVYNFIDFFRLKTFNISKVQRMSNYAIKNLENIFEKPFLDGKFRSLFNIENSDIQMRKFSEYFMRTFNLIFLTEVFLIFSGKCTSRKYNFFYEKKNAKVLCNIIRHYVASNFTSSVGYSYALFYVNKVFYTSTELKKFCMYLLSCVTAIPERINRLNFIGQKIDDDTVNIILSNRSFVFKLLSILCEFLTKDDKN